MPDKVPVENVETGSASSASETIKKKFIASSSSASDSDDIGELDDSVFEGGVFRSRADIKLAKKIDQINNDENPRSSIFFKKIPTRSSGEGRATASNGFDRSSYSSKSFKAIESRHERVSNKSRQNASVLNEFTANSAANREKL